MMAFKTNKEYLQKFHLQQHVSKNLFKVGRHLQLLHSECNILAPLQYYKPFKFSSASFHQAKYSANLNQPGHLVYPKRIQGKRVYARLPDPGASLRIAYIHFIWARHALGTSRVAKCHRYGRYICVKKLKSWGKKCGKTCTFC